MNNSTTEALIVKYKVANQPKIDERLSAGLISMHVSLITCLLIWFHKDIYNKIMCKCYILWLPLLLMWKTLSFLVDLAHDPTSKIIKALKKTGPPLLNYSFY